MAQAFGGGNCSGPVPVAAALAAHGRRQDFEVETFVAHALRADGFDASEDGTGRGTPLVPVSFQTRGSNLYVGEEAGTLGTNSGSVSGCAPCIAFSAKDHGADAMEDCSPTLRAGGHTGSHANAGVMPAVAFAHQAGGKQTTLGYSDDGTCQTLGACQTPAVAHRWGVRRLMPIECERLQGFPDRWTEIEWRGKPADKCPDGPRYKAIGNSKAINVVTWIGERIDAVEQAVRAEQAAA